MKKNLLSILVMFVIAVSGYSQVPDAFNYQAVVRNSAGEVIADQNVSFRISILQDSETGTPIYVETHTLLTNSFGLASLQIGKGTFVSGAFSPDAWGSNSHFIKVELDPAGGNSYVHLGTTQLLSVPYAFHAETSNSSQWQNDESDIYFNAGKVGIGEIPGADLRQFQVNTENNQAIAGENNSAAYATIYARNFGTGLAADFRNNIRILDGTEGEGKVLTSDAGGESSWQTPVSTGPVAFGTVWANGTLWANSGNISVSKTAVGYYEITITGENYYNDGYITIATLVGSSGFIVSSALSSKLLIATYNTSAALTDRNFSFVVYKP